MSMEDDSNPSNLNTVESKKQRKTYTPRSNVWKHFTKYVDEHGQQRSKCNYCSANYGAQSKHSGTSNMRNHILSKLAFSIEEDEETGDSKVNLQSFKFDQKKGRRAVAKMLVVDKLPFNKDDQLSNMAMSMTLKFNKYCGDLNKFNLLVFIASLFDPRTKLAYLKNSLGRASNKASSSSSKIVNEDTSSTKGFSLFGNVDDTFKALKERKMAEVKRQKAELGVTEDLKTELDRYLKEEIEGDDVRFEINSDPRATPAGNLTCGSGRATTVSFIPTFVQAMERLSSNLNNSNNNFAVTNVTDPTLAPFYALIQCHRDLSRTDCLVCYAVSRTAVPGCLPRTSGRIFLDGCFVRYDNYSFFQEAVDPATDARNCTSGVLRTNWDDFEGGLVEFNRSANELVENVTNLALNNGGFGVMGLKGVYGLAQCWESLTNDECRVCLNKAKSEAIGCLPSREGRSMIAGCYLRYSTQKFFNNVSAADGGSSGLSSPGAKVAVVLAAVAFLMISSFAGYAAYIRISKIREERKNLGMLSNSFNKSGLKYKYETLEKATNYFDLSNKLGQGGAGSVYKGLLPNGDVVAVKRLFFNTRQWVDEFFNEVNLISAIEHKNLVKLLACSIEGPESLLVYEFVPNKSLDHFLFDKDKVQVLSWKQRMGVILGTAEGLVYLHGGCHHVFLLQFNHLFCEKCRGNLCYFRGYMAPEYIVRGQLTEKADVFSFGVVVLEIACGKRNNAFVEDTGSLLQTVWKLYKEGIVSEAIDPLLKGDFPQDEALEVLQIGLLCTQASAALRPSMAEVVELLTTKPENRQNPIRIPHQPPFLNARSLMSQGLSSSTSSPLTKMGVSYTNTSRSSTTPSSEWPLRIDELSSS
ncbi:hypothetical protein E3N88_24233 [Mikania micrantha]|uniref:Protein kinase domain-containing protein n=1 Tax=Mikania micrantha TaxID=192012 RepID=A0A5N6NFJ5_9ASTR|nr:hypothetical protein E3N88_24233 [Mikania micrantha]